MFLRKIFQWMLGHNTSDEYCDPIIKTIGTIVECNASECMDNFEGQCILTNISLTKDKLRSGSAFACSEYSTEDQELKSEFNKEACIRG